MLEQAGFTVPNAQEQETADQPAGTVLSQSPAAGETSRLGSTVDAGGRHHAADAERDADTHRDADTDRHALPTG